MPLTRVKSDYKYWNLDGLIIDSTDYSIIPIFIFFLVPSTPLALGHMINHPSDPARPELKPNVMIVPYEFSKKQGNKFSPIIPNRYVAPEKFFYKLANNHVLAASFVRVVLCEILKRRA